MDPSFRKQTSTFSSQTYRSIPSSLNPITSSLYSTSLLVRSCKPNIKISCLLTCEGYTGGFNEQQTDRDHPFEQANQPATLPRVSVMHIITERSPWCTTI